MENKTDTYGMRLKQLRKDSGLDQLDLADKSRVAVGTIRNHEQDRGMMTIDHMFAYCQAMGINCDSFKGCTAKEDRRVTPNPSPAKNPSRKKKA